MAGEAQVPIENPVINSPFVEPTRHFTIEDGRVSGKIEDRRRPSEYYGDEVMKVITPGTRISS